MASFSSRRVGVGSFFISILVPFFFPQGDVSENLYGLWCSSSWSTACFSSLSLSLSLSVLSSTSNEQSNLVSFDYYLGCT